MICQSQIDHDRLILDHPWPSGNTCQETKRKKNPDLELEDVSTAAPSSAVALRGSATSGSLSSGPAGWMGSTLARGSSAVGEGQDAAPMPVKKAARTTIKERVKADPQEVVPLPNLLERARRSPGLPVLCFIGGVRLL